MKNLIPRINGNVITGEDYFVLPEKILISDVFPVTVRIFGERLRKMGEYTLVPSEERVLIRYVENKDLNGEAYAIKIEPLEIVVESSTEHGFSNALVSLYQLLTKGNGIIQCGQFNDVPKYPQRGFMLDCCRHFFPIEDVKRILEYCALLKFTHFHWHLSEDQGFRIESEKFPKLNSVSSYRKLHEKDPLVKKYNAEVGTLYGGYYTKKEIKDLVQFAADRQIEVYPEFDLPGHSVAALAAYPQYSCSGLPGEVENRFGIFERIFCAGKEETYDFLFALLDEVCELFPSKYFHLGGDEAPKSEWRNCPDCNRVMMEQGFTSYEELQAYFTEKLILHLKEKGKVPVVWNEASASGKLDSSAVLQYWHEGDGEDYTKAEIAKNRKFILSEINSFYCDYAYKYVTLKNTLTYEPKIQGEPIPKKNILGIEAPMWCEEISYCEEIEKMINPRLLAAAENGWSETLDYDDFMSRLEEYQKCEILNFLKTLAPGEQMGVGYIFEPA